jgi:hypothetical protein
VPWSAFDITTLRDGTIRMTLDATKERSERAPRIEGKNYERIYTYEVAEPIFVYWEVDYVDQSGRRAPNWRDASLTPRGNGTAAAGAILTAASVDVAPPTYGSRHPARYGGTG